MYSSFRQPSRWANTVTSFLSFTNLHARAWSEAWRVPYIIIALLRHPVIGLVVQSWPAKKAAGPIHNLGKRRL